MRKFSPILFMCMLFLCIQGTFINDALAYPNEVRWSGSSYIWRTDNVDRGTTSSLATAINNCMSAGREIHVLTGGTLTSTLVVRAANVKLYCHGNTFTRNFSGTGVTNTYNGFEIHDMILRDGSNGYGIRSSGASNLKFINVQIYNCPWIGIRVDSRESNPWNYWIYNLEVRNCLFDDMGSHGLETYSVDGFTIDGIVARNTGECGVLLNQSRNGTVGSVDAYRCATNTGYAALRFANSCSNIEANTLIARECGRGYFVLSGSNNCHLDFAKITDGTGVGVWLENVVNCSVKSGCTNDGVAVTGSGSYANVSNGTNCTPPGTGLTIQENAVGFCSVDGTIDNNNAGFTDEGFINTDNATGAGAAWRINTPTAGAYTLTWRHANGGGANRPARLLANGTQIVSSIGFNATANWTTWAEVSVNVNLSAGQNTLRLESTTAAGTSNIDYLKVTGNNPAAVSCSGVIPDVTITIQENSTGFCMVDGSVDNNNAGFTGTGFANANNALGAGVTWRINAAAAGPYSLTWRQANGGGANRPARLLTNGTQIVSSINFNPTANWTTWEDVSVDVNLSAGENTLRLESTTAAGLANIDYLEVTGNNPTALSCSGASARMQTGEIEEAMSDEEAISVDVHPNPAMEEVTVTLPYSYNEGEKIVNLLDGTGKTAVSEKFSGTTHTLHIGSLPQGMYVLKVSSNKKPIVKKVIKK